MLFFQFKSIFPSTICLLANHIISLPISELCLCDVRFVQLDENNLIFQIIFVIDHHSTDIYSTQKKKEEENYFNPSPLVPCILGGGYNMVEYNITIKRFCIAERHIAKLAVWYGVLLFNEN